MKPHAFHPEAAEEYARAAEYYAQAQPELGQRFFEEIERLISEIIHDPKRFRHFEPPAQRHFSSLFPYAIIYVEQSDRIWILSVMHLKRRPGYWKKRISEP